MLAAAGTSIVKYAVDYARECYRAYGHCRRLQQDRILDQSQAQDLRTCFEDLADVLDMYDEEVERAVSFKHKKKIGRLLAKIYDNLALFKKDIERFENIVKSGVPGDDDIKILREELRNIRATLVDQKATFLGLVTDFHHYHISICVDDNSVVSRSRCCTDDSARLPVCRAMNRGEVKTSLDVIQIRV